MRTLTLAIAEPGQPRVRPSDHGWRGTRGKREPLEGESARNGGRGRGRECGGGMREYTGGVRKKEYVGG